MKKDLSKIQTTDADSAESPGCSFCTKTLGNKNLSNASLKTFRESLVLLREERFVKHSDNCYHQRLSAALPFFLQKQQEQKTAQIRV